MNMVRCFVVGSPRSGTTLVQSILASHPQVWSLPETHFFRRLDGYRYGPKGLLVSRGADTLIRELSTELGVNPANANLGGLSYYAPPPPTLRGYGRRFASTLDTHAYFEQAQVWVEKTPDHVRRIRAIRWCIPDAVFVHVLRDGADVVASQVYWSREHPGPWGGPQTIEQAAQRWREDVAFSRRWEGKPGHVLLDYTQVVESGGDLGPAWDLLGLDPVRADHRARLDKIVRPGEKWKRCVANTIAPQPSQLDSFPAEDRARIIALTS